MSKNIQLQQCPRCGAHVEQLLPIETGMKVALQAAGQAADLPSTVCARCYEQLTGMVSQGVRLRLEEEARQKNKMMLWKSRTSLIRQGRQLMAQKAFSEAAVSFEKYLKIMEMVHSLGPGQLTPEHFNNSIRSKELTVVTSVYWDLFRIYDMSPKYLDRMKFCSQKLSEFLSYSSIYPDIIKKAQIYQRQSKHPDVVRDFLRKTSKKRPMCFVATAAFEAPLAPEVTALRRFRDEQLKTRPFGRRLVAFYYRKSPAIASFLNQNPQCKAPVRLILRLFLLALRILRINS
ncbi:MAG: CFI-box-CTERM domain-containing protein [Pseudomonadota bacterium]